MHSIYESIILLRILPTFLLQDRNVSDKNKTQITKVNQKWTDLRDQNFFLNVPTLAVISNQRIFYKVFFMVMAMIKHNLRTRT